MTLAAGEVAAEEFTVEADQTLDLVIEVETVSFVLVAARPIEDRGRVVVVELVASLNNETGPIPGPSLLSATVSYGGVEVETVTLAELTQLAAGITEANVTYRPEGGWQPGTYRFLFELVTPAFTLTAPDQPVVEVPMMSFDLLAFLTALDIREAIALAVAGLLTLVLIERLIRSVITRKRRRSHNPGTTPASTERRGKRAKTRRSRRADRKRNRSAPSQTDESWLEERIDLESTPSTRRNDKSQSLSEPKTAPVVDDQTTTTTTLTSDRPPPIEQTNPPHPPQPTREPGNAVMETALAPFDHRHLHPIPPPSPGPITANSEPAAIAGSLRLIQNLHDRSMLSSEWSIADATIIHWVLTSPEIQNKLTSAGVTKDEYADVITRLLSQGLLGRPNP